MCDVSVRPGDRFDGLRSSWDRVGDVMVTADTPAEALRLAEAAAGQDPDRVVPDRARPEQGHERRDPPVVGPDLPDIQNLDVIVTGLSSDAHTWNLVYLHLLLEELGCRVTNLGGCTPDEIIVRECLARRPDLLVIGSLNGHGAQDGLRLIEAIRAHPALVTTPVAIGGKLDVVGGSNAAALLAAGFDAVFEDAGGLAPFRSFLHAVAVRAAAPIGVR